MSHSDVLIIGAGPAGGVAGLRLAQAGLSVTALERGRWQDRARYRGTEWDWELASGRQWASQPTVRQGADDYPIDLSQSDMSILNFCGVGGGSILYNAVWIRLLEANFASKSRFGWGDDWPISYAELQPFYERTDQQVGVSGLGGNPAYPPGAEPPLPPLPFNPAAMRVAREMHRRGWHWWPDSNAIISTNYDGRHQCVRRGTCAQGCNEGAKSSFDLTHWRKFVALGGRLETGARVRRIIHDARGLALGAEWVDDAGQVHVDTADIVLMAANGVGTPRLLLHSASERFPGGLANRSGLVGRRLMLHPLAVLFPYFDQPLRGWQGQNGSTVQCLEFAEDNPARGFRAGTKWAMHPSGSGPLGEAARVLLSGAGPGDFHARFAQRFGHGQLVSIMCEDLPDEDNRVVLSPDMVDTVGVPAARLIYQTSKDSAAALAFSVERATEMFLAAGATEVQAINPAGGNAHMTGTARMGDDPAHSVVDRWGMAHDMPNLGIIDGSVFVTCGAVNPTSTIAALSLRTAEHIIANRDALPRPDRSGVTVHDLGRVSFAPPAPPAPPLTDAERAALLALADGLIPAVDDIAAAGAVIGPALLDRALSVRPDLVAQIRAGLAHAPASVGALLAVDYGLWNAMVTAIGGAYYLDERVRARIGYDGQIAQPQNPDRYPAYFEEGMLDHLLSGEWRARRKLEEA